MIPKRRKTCRTCKVEKSFRHFYRHPTYADGRMDDCKDCKRAYARDNRMLKLETIRARKRIYNMTPARRAARKAYQQSPRGREVHREACRFYRMLRRPEQPNG